jgi:hypothetical protein
MKSIADIKYAFYINLLKRTDRKKHVEEQLSSVGIVGTRFNAVELTNGALGCSLSHLKCLKNAFDNDGGIIDQIEHSLKMQDVNYMYDKVDLRFKEKWVGKTGKTYKKVELAEHFFGEGITILNNK